MSAYEIFGSSHRAHDSYFEETKPEIVKTNVQEPGLKMDDHSGDSSSSDTSDNSDVSYKSEKASDDDASGFEADDADIIPESKCTRATLKQGVTKSVDSSSAVEGITKGSKSKKAAKVPDSQDGSTFNRLVGSYTMPGVRYSDDSGESSHVSDNEGDENKVEDGSSNRGLDAAVGSTKKRGTRNTESVSDVPKNKSSPGRRKGHPRKITSAQSARGDTAKGEGSGRSKASSAKSKGSGDAKANASGSVGGQDGIEVAPRGVNRSEETVRRRKGRPRKILNFKDDDSEKKDDDDDADLERKDDDEDDDGDYEKGKRPRRNEKVVCDKCGKTVSRLYISRHMHHIHSAETFQCEQCRRVLRTEKAYLHHLMVKHSEKSPHKCTICGVGLSSGRALSHHTTRIHGSPDDKPFQCELCEKRFLLKNDLQLHMACHSSEKPFICETCGKGFNNKGSLKTHYRIHTGEKPFKCQYCDQSFSFKNSLQGHERRHTGETPYLCSYCGKGFPTRPALLKHSIVHSDDRPFKCTQCEKTFRSRPAFTTHKDFHLGIKRWECKVCKRRFLFQGNMIKHSRRHLADRPHVCEVCGKGFVQKQELKTHMKTHTGESRAKKKPPKSANQHNPVAPLASQQEVHSSDFVLPVQQDKPSNPPVSQSYGFDKTLSMCHFNQNPVFSNEKPSGIVQQNQYKMPGSGPSPYKVPNVVPPTSGCCELPYGNLLQGSDNMHHHVESMAPPSGAGMMMNVPEEMYQQTANDIELLQTAVNPYTYLASSAMPANPQMTSTSYEGEKQNSVAQVIRCKLCNKDFTTNRYIRKHLIEYHRVNNPEDFFYNLS